MEKSTVHMIRITTAAMVTAAAIFSCKGDDVVLGVCEMTDDCPSGTVCAFGLCIVDDFFQGGSQEGAPQPGGGTAVMLDSSCYQLPVDPYKITGYHHGSSVGGGKVHAGDDVNGAAGTPVYAIYDGVVHYADAAGTWGGLVEISHINPTNAATFYSLYGHLNAPGLQVSQGQVVSKGQLLGYLGNYAENGGWAEHLHFSIYTGVHPQNGVLAGHVASLAGYENPIPWLEMNCPDCGCSGALDTASVLNADELFVSGSLECDAGVDKWSLAVNEDVVFSSFPGEPAVSFSENVDLAPYNLPSGEASVGLWARSAGNDTACLLDSKTIDLGGSTGDGDGDGDGCVDGAETHCVGNDVYFFDSCGVQGNVAETCTGGAVCVEQSPTTAACEEPPPTCTGNGADLGEECDGNDLQGETCQSQGFDSGTLMCNDACQIDTSGCCNDNEYHQCYNGDVWWYDSCDQLGALKENCGGGEVCIDQSPVTASCMATCGNGVLDPGEDCDGGVNGTTCEALGYDGGQLSCANDCTFDESDCVTCTIVASPAINSWTPNFVPQTNCSCTEQNTACHTLYQGRVNSINGNTANMSFKKTDGTPPSVSSSFWVVVGEPFPSCTLLGAYVTRVSGNWANNIGTLNVNVGIWPSLQDYEAAPNGETKDLFIITGGAGAPNDRTWFEKQAVTFTKVCN
jgi:hypothetical protein